MEIIDIISLIFLAISLIFFEIGYKKNKTKIFIYGLEFLALAIFTLLMKHIPRVLGITVKKYAEVGICSFVIYYVLKSSIQYTIKKYNELKSLSDIKEIVKDEPTKKATKRKNIKIEEGK